MLYASTMHLLRVDVEETILVNNGYCPSVDVLDKLTSPKSHSPSIGTYILFS